MSNYVLKNGKNKGEVLLYQEKVNYILTPKKDFKGVKKVTILDVDMINNMYEKKIERDYQKLIKVIYALVSSEDTTSGDVLACYKEIKRINNYLLSLKEKGLKKELLEKYLKKLYILELELKKVHVMELEEEIGKGR